MSETVGKCWKVSESVGKCQKVSEGVRKCPKSPRLFVTCFFQDCAEHYFKAYLKKSKNENAELWIMKMLTRDACIYLMKEFK